MISNSFSFTFVLLSVLIGINYCSVIHRREGQNETDLTGLIRDNYGCDAILSSCGSKGACCDDHDRCYLQYGCTSISWLYLWGNCQMCNLAVMACSVRQNPGVSSCCSTQNCGQLRPKPFFFF